MSVTAEMIDALVESGCTVDELIDAYMAACEAKKAQGPRYISPELRASVLERDKHTCVYCGATDQPLHCDHVIPYSKGGQTKLENLAAACKPCNSSKKDRTLDEWRRGE